MLLAGERATALLACCPPSTTPSLLGPACNAGRHPSYPVLLSESLVGQRRISAQTIQLLVPATLNYVDALQHLYPLSPVHCQLLPLRHLQLTQQRPHSPYAYLLALHCCFCNHWSCVKLKPTVVALPVVVYSTAAAAAGGSALRGGWRPVWFVDARGCFAGATVCAAVGLG
jgi:hypothetical protein